MTWQLVEGSNMVRELDGPNAERDARDLVIISANPSFWARDKGTGSAVRWGDVCAEPWPNRPDDPNNAGDDPNYPYGAQPPEWPYGNGC